ncbi:carbohydrate porin [Rubritalea tangerina]|uniref:Carbohydrate porin n=2 Tax=Rubritalea tangerina TaxID=430798 RepID=A0ABW4ZF25_9BACT
MKCLWKLVSLSLTCLCLSAQEPAAVTEVEELSLAGLQDNERANKSIFSTDRLELALTYSALIQAAVTEGESAGSGELHLGGRWVFINEDYPSRLMERIGGESDGLLCIKFRIRHRHSLLDIPASQLAGSIGSILGTTDGFSNSGFEIPDLYVQHIFHDGKVELRYGQLAVESRLDSHAMRSAKKAFLNRVFSTNPAVPYPRFGAGGIARWQINDYFDLTYALTQVQASKTGAQVDFDLNSNDLFTAIQTGFTWGKKKGTESHIQAMLWAADGTEDAQEDYGFSLGYEAHFEDSDKSLFLRFANSHGTQSDLNRMGVIGFGKTCRETDLFGLGIGVGRSSATSDIQGVIETFYRYQAPFQLEITPDIQFLVGNGLRGDYEIVTGLRGHFNF